MGLSSSMTSKQGFLGFGAAMASVAIVSFVAYSGHLPRGLSMNPVDKILHGSMAATLAFFLDRGLRGRPLWSGSIVPRAALLVVPLGIEEYLQRFSATRSSSLGDFAADALGVVIGILAARTLKS